MHEAMQLFTKDACPNFIWQTAHRRFFCILGKVYFLKSQKDSFLRENQSLRRNFLRLCQIFMEAGRNIPPRNFVYTGTAPYRAAQGEIQKKTPAVAAAGI